MKKWRDPSPISIHAIRLAPDGSTPSAESLRHLTNHRHRCFVTLVVA